MAVLKSFDARYVVTVIEGRLPLSVIGCATDEMLESFERLALTGDA
jgi:hypothetical protein